jgi:hypothetical protein
MSPRAAASVTRSVMLGPASAMGSARLKFQ